MIKRFAAVMVSTMLALWACDAKDDGAVALAGATQAIQGGTLDTTSSNVVGIVLSSGGMCTGSLIAPNLVLTARHCVAEATITTCESTTTFGTTFPVSDFRVTTSGTAAAGLQFWPTVDNVTWFAVSQVYLPTSPANGICGGDMALLRLSSNVNGVCPLIPRVDSPVTLNEGLTAVGLGITSPTGMTFGTRYSVSGLKVTCAANCGFGTSPTGEWIGGSNSGVGACQGDSGGPALDAQRRVIGTVSRGPQDRCSNTVYESVYAQASLIKNVASQAATSGGYAPAAWVTGGSTSINPCSSPGTGGGTGGTGGGTGTGGGSATGGGSGTGGGGSSTSNCPVGTTCVDLSAQGGLACVGPGNSIPPGSPSCANASCPSGFSCWQPTGSSPVCLRDCQFGGAGGGSGGGGNGGGTAGTGGGMSNTGGGTAAGGASGTQSTPYVFPVFSQQNQVAPQCSVTSGSTALWLAALWSLRRRTSRSRR